MELADERRFTIVDSKEMSTMAFLINEPESNTSCATIQKLDYVMQDSADSYKKTFYINNTTVEDANVDFNILLLTISKERAFINMAILRNEELLVSKEPANVSYKTLRTENSVSYQNINYTPNFKRPISIIDPEIADEVRPVLYMDEEAGMVRARVRLLPNKSYIALEVLRNEAGNYQTNYTICNFE